MLKFICVVWILLLVAVTVISALIYLGAMTFLIVVGLLFAIMFTVFSVIVISD